jgi:hypothetical protein
MVTALMQLAEERVQQESVAKTDLQDADQRLLQGLMERLEAMKRNQQMLQVTVNGQGIDITGKSTTRCSVMTQGYSWSVPSLN